MGKRWCYRDWW